MVCLIVVSNFFKVNARFGHDGDQVDQVKDQVCQGQAQELDNNAMASDSWLGQVLKR